MNARTRTRRPAGPDAAQTARKAILVALAIVLAAAIALRAAGLGRWSLHADELASAWEIYSPQDDPFSLFRTMPLGHLPTMASVAALGRTHVGIRLGALVCGVLSLFVVAAMAWRLWGLRAALTASLLIGLSGWHIYFSQYGRFYAPAFLLCAVFLAALIVGLQENRRGWLTLAVVAGAALPYTHSHAVFFVAAAVGVLGLLLALPGVRPAELTRATLLTMTGTMVLFALPWLWVVLQVAGTWAERNAWNYGPVHTALGLVNNLGVGLAAAAAIGAAAAIFSPDWKGRLLLGVSLLFPLVLIALSLRISVRQDYIFPGSIAIYLLAAWGIEQVARSSQLVWGALMLLVLASQLPGLLSYYSCGNRFPVEQACAFVGGRMAEGDVVVSDTSGLARYYGIVESATRISRLYLEDREPAEPAPAWFIRQVSRREEPAPLDRWLAANARLEREIAPKRYDYFEMKLRIWYYPGRP
jgi:hypothetical protein